MYFIITIGIGAVILIAQQLLSKYENWILGSILTIESLLFVIGVFHFGKKQFNIRNLLKRRQVVKKDDTPENVIEQIKKKEYINLFMGGPNFKYIMSKNNFKYTLC